MKVRTEVKIGFIVLATIALVIFGINYLKGKNVIKRTDVYYAVFNDISGLKQSATIYINGMKIGVINSIDFRENDYSKIIVALSVNKGIIIPKNSSVQLYSSDLLGNKALKIIPSGELEMANYGDTLVSGVQLDMFASLQSELDPFKQKTENAIVSLDSLVNALNNVLDPVSQKNLQLLIANLEESTKMLQMQLGPNGHMSLTLQNLSEFSKVLKDNKDKLNAVFGNLEEITDSIAQANLRNTLVNLNKTFEQTQELLKGINEGKGSLGMLATNDSLYKNLESVTANLAILLEDMEKNPRRYVHFSLFGKKDKSPSE